MVFHQDTFHCKLSTSVHLVDTDKEKESVYLVLDATNIRAICLPKSEDVPLNVVNAFIKQARCVTATDIVSLQFTLKQKVHLIVPKSALQKRPSTITDVDTLLRLGQCDTFTVYVPSDSINQRRLPDLCEALDQGATKPSDRHIKSLYGGAGSKVITCLGDLWTLNRPENPPPYDPSTAPGATDSEPTSHSDFRDTRNPRKHGKRRTTSPIPRQTPPKRQLLAEKVVQQPWEVAFAALSAEFATLREQLQQLQRAPGVDAGTQTDPFEEHAPASCSVPDPHCSSPSQASTVENTTEDRLLMVEDSTADGHKQLALLAEKVDHKDKQIRQELEIECFGLQSAVENIESRVDDLESGLQDDLRQEFEEHVNAKTLDLQVKLEEFIEHRLEDVEEVVKHDVRMALENASCKFKIDLGWSE
ncbi:hypothetical protein KCU64_g8914, partial [Aureobasidium melanogenum]